ncbi:MAG: hypothetical protein HRF50_17015 [Phycisphaerae bacterium]
MSRAILLIVAASVLACASDVRVSAGELIRPESIGFKRAVYHAATGCWNRRTAGRKSVAVL